jgi:hypothetical protein
MKKSVWDASKKECKKCYGRGYLGYNIITHKVVACPDCFEEQAEKEGLKKFLVWKLLKSIWHSIYTLPGYLISLVIGKRAHHGG